MKEAEASPRGVLKVTAPPAFAELFMDGMLSDFARAYPDVRLILDLSDRFVDLVAEGFDVALRAGPLPDSSLKARLLGSAPLHCYASPEYVRRKGAPQTPEELADHDVLAFGTDDRAMKWSFIVKKAVRPFQLKPRMTLNSFVLLRQLAEAGLGIARMPAPLAAESVEQGRLVEVITRFALPPSPLHAVFVSSPHPSPKARAFLDHLSAHFASEPLPRRRPQIPQIG